LNYYLINPNHHSGKIIDCNFASKSSMDNLKELKALISLVDEPDSTLYNQVKERLFVYGVQALPELEAAWENTLDDAIQQRLIALIHEIQQRQLFTELSDWSKFGYNDLLRGYLLVTRFNYPDLDADKITREVGHIIQQVWLELNNNLTALEQIKVVNHVFYDINKFTGNTANINSPDNFYLKNLLESRKGNPLSLGIFYLVITRSLKIPVYGVDLPRHFILAYMEDSGDDSNANGEEALFYLNPFNKGAVFTKNEIELYIKQMKLNPESAYFTPCTNIVIIKRLINGLIETYTLAGNLDKAEDLKHLLTAMEL
jgi:regulator of sirC expression with transglutaminase-like and TPR domain